jgi:tRNA pseudouridine32 synthase/23S rRNA pseudouridine746 synthase/23S rRNA pseudouridine1911/1915/1917 synthase
VYRPGFLLDRLLYRDAMMLIVDKPAGLPVHAGPGGGPNLEQFFEPLKFGLPRLPALAHRLDRDTSGCLILGRHRKALARLGKLFQNGKIEKTYWAIVEGIPAEPGGRIDMALQKVARKDAWRMIADPAGQSAVTDYKVLGQGNGLSWIEFYPRTGRTHQIRVHATAISCPILGDQIYGRPDANKGLHLHSRGITVPLYPTKDPVTAIAPPPEHMQAALRACGYI